jgi:outer membrane protein
MKFRNLIFCLVLAALAGAGQDLSARPQKAGEMIDPNDSLALPRILKQVLETYPTVIRAQEAIRAAEAGIGLAKSAYYPHVSGDAGYVRIGPVPELTIPDMGHFSFAPEDNLNAAVGAYGKIYDFEKTSRNVDMEKKNRELAEKNVELVRQRLSLLTSVSYYTLIYLQEAIMIKESQIDNLQKHLDFVTRKEQTGSATQYEILSTKVRLSNAENQKVDLETSRQTQQAILNSLMGLPVKTSLKVRKNFLAMQPGISSDSLIIYALDHRYEMVLAKLKEEHAQLHMRAVRVMNNPTLNAFLTGGFKNGYIPDLNKLTANYSAGLGLNVPIFDATRRRNTIRLVNSEISMTQSETEQTSREISTEVYQNQTSLLASLKKIDQGELQVKQAEEALSLAAVSFRTGVITNLDLLDAETALAESRVNLLRAKIDYAISVVRLNLSVGKPI